MNIITNKTMIRMNILIFEIVVWDIIHFFLPFCTPSSIVSKSTELVLHEAKYVFCIWSMFKLVLVPTVYWGIPHCHNMITW